jgi:DNA polymerase-1
MINWGPEKYGAKLLINTTPEDYSFSGPIVIDIETNEQDGFVGIGITDNGEDICYFTELTKDVKGLLEVSKLVTQGGAFDIRMLRKWGVNVSYDNILYDTKILAYVYGSTMLNYGLKPLAKKFLNMEYPSYKEIVGTGKKKKTLDQQPVEVATNYCGCDVLATYKLCQLLWNKMSAQQKKFFNEIEMPTYRLLSQMEDKGVYVDVDKLKRIDGELSQKMKQFEDKLKQHGDFNPRSPKQILEFLRKNGITVKATNESELEPLKDNPLISDLLQYRKYKKLQSTYTEPYINSTDLPYLHTRYLQSTDTGRLASRNPNLQNIPVEEGIREIFVAPPKHKLLIFDYSQIETRLFAHFSKDPVLVEIFKAGRHVHKEMANRVGCSPKVGKTLVHGMTYGSSPRKVAEVANLELEEAQNIYYNFWNQLQVGAAWISMQKLCVHKTHKAETLLGRVRSFEELKEVKCYHRFSFRCKKCRIRGHIERQIISTIIQGSASDIIKKAMLDCYKAGYFPRLSVHDELHFYIPEEKANEETYTTIKNIMENVVQLEVPLTVEGKYVNTWKEAK